MRRHSAMLAAALLALATAAAQAREGEREDDRTCGRAVTVNEGSRRSTARQLFSAGEEMQLKYLGLDYRFGLRTEAAGKATTSTLRLAFSVAKGASYLDPSSGAGRCPGKGGDGDKAASAAFREGQGDDQGDDVEGENGAGLTVSVSIGAGRWSEGFDSVMKGALAERVLAMAVAKTYQDVLQPGPRFESQVLCDTTGKEAMASVMDAVREGTCPVPNMKVVVEKRRFACGFYPLLEKSERLRCGMLSLVKEVLGHAACATLAGDASGDVREIPKAVLGEVGMVVQRAAVEVVVQRAAVEGGGKGINYGVCSARGDGGGTVDNKK